MEITFYLDKKTEAAEDLLELISIIILLTGVEVIIKLLVLQLYIKEQVQVDGKLKLLVILL